MHILLKTLQKTPFNALLVISLAKLATPRLLCSGRSHSLSFAATCGWVCAVKKKKKGKAKKGRRIEKLQKKIRKRRGNRKAFKSKDLKREEEEDQEKVTVTEK